MSQPWRRDFYWHLVSRGLETAKFPVVHRTALQTKDSLCQNIGPAEAEILKLSDLLQGQVYDALGNSAEETVLPAVCTSLLISPAKQASPRFMDEKS